MRTRTALATALVGLLAAGSIAPAVAAKPKPKPKPIVGSYDATAYPDPTSTDPVTSEVCVPKLPTGKFSKSFTVPAAGVLHIELANQLDWSINVRDAEGTSEASADGGSPEVKEMVDISFKRKSVISIDTCNFAGEPTVKVNYKFTYR